MAEIIEVNLASPEFKCDPERILGPLRADHPVARIAVPDGETAWLITRWKDANAVFKDPRFRKDERSVLSAEEIARTCSSLEEELMMRHLSKTDPPEHTRLRACFAPLFAPHRVEGWREDVQAIVNDTIAQFPRSGPVDLVPSFASHIPSLAVCRLLLRSSHYQPLMIEYANHITARDIGPVTDDVKQSIKDLLVLVKELIQEIRARPEEGLLGDWLSTEDSEGPLTTEEILAMVSIIIRAGVAATEGLLANGVLLLLQHPDQMDLLREEPDLADSAIDEMLRYRPPSTLTTPRWVHEDLKMHGHTLRRGDMVLVSVVAANHDPAVFPHPERFDIRRRDNHHLGFGKGIHYCLGASLGRLEGKTAFPTLLNSFPRMRLACPLEQVPWTPGMKIAVPQSLPVELDRPVACSLT
ncbi:cytochrome P450 [Saccharopolyspora shandongensis]|uniref:cytochrome P450 n=1 Tax=Saccharopolyspora shandongensis TaxID=418495 RepID=UPI0033C3A4CD